MAIAIVEDLWGRIRAHIDDKITAAKDASESAEAAATRAEQHEAGAASAAAGAAEGVRSELDNKVSAAEAAATRAEQHEAGAASAAAAEVEKLKGDAPEAFDTLGEIAAELASNESERSALTNSIAAKADKTYVDSETARVTEVTFSRGQQAVVNGNGQLGGDYWSDFLTFVPTDAPTGTFGSWENPEKQSVAWNSREIVIDPTLPTYMSAYARQAKAGGSATMYLALAAVDQDGNSISAVNIMFREGTTTTLAQDLNPGDTTVHLTDASNWYNESSGVPRRMIFWNYVSASGKVWGPETYSRNATGDSTWLEGGVDYNSNTITLAAPWSGDPVPAGTYLSNGNNGSNYMYARQSTVNHDSWAKVEGVVAGKQDLTGKGFAPSRGWPPGVSAVRPGVLLNYSGTPSVSNMRFANVYVSQLATLGHTHTIGDVTGLEDALTAAGTAEHTHPQSEVDGLEVALDGKSDVGHTHTSEDITDATDAVQRDSSASGNRVVKTRNDGMLYMPHEPTSSTHPANKAYVDTQVDTKADASHTHTPASIGAAPASHEHTAAQISDATAVGRNVLKAADAAAARTAIGAGTSSLALGTTSSTAAKGDHTHTASDVGAAPASHDHTAAQISDATTVGRNVLKASSQSAARSAIGAGTSNLALGTTSSTAAAGNHTHSQYATTTTVNGVSSRVTTLEGNAPIIVSSLPASPLPGRIYLVTG